MSTFLLIIMVMGRRTLMAAAAIACIWYPEHFREWLLTFIVLAVGETIYQGAKIQHEHDEKSVTTSSQTIYSKGPE